MKPFVRQVTATNPAVVAPPSPDMVPLAANAFPHPMNPALGRCMSLLLGLALWVSATDAHADIYRFVDKEGVIHFNVNKRGKLIAFRKPAGNARRARRANAPRRRTSTTPIFARPPTCIRSQKRWCAR